MSPIPSGISRKARTLQAFRNQIRFVRHHGFGKKSRHVEIACTKLEKSVARLEQLFGEVARAQLEALKGSTIKQWRRALRNRFLLPLRYTAYDALHLKLTVPHREASNAAFIAAGQAFCKALRPHRKVLVENGHDDDCLEVLRNSTAKLKQWTTQQTASAKKADQLGKEEDAEMARARSRAKALHGAMLAFCEDEPNQLGKWNQARRIPKRIGQTRGIGGHLIADTRRAKPDRTVRGKPQDWGTPADVPLEEESPPEDPLAQ